MFTSQSSYARNHQSNCVIIPDRSIGCTLAETTPFIIRYISLLMYNIYSYNDNGHNYMGIKEGQKVTLIQTWSAVFLLKIEQLSYLQLGKCSGFMLDKLDW